VRKHVRGLGEAIPIARSALRKRAAARRLSKVMNRAAIEGIEQVIRSQLGRAKGHSTKLRILKGLRDEYSNRLGELKRSQIGWATRRSPYISSYEKDIEVIKKRIEQLAKGQPGRPPKFEHGWV